MLLRTAVQTLAMLLVLGAILLGAAGEWRWSQAWWFLAELGATSVIASVWLARSDPALLEARLASPFAKNQAAPDRLLIIAIGVGFLVWLGAMGLDRRFHWSNAPTAVEVLGAVLIVVGFAGVCWTFSANTFASTQIRIQAERAQEVITSGPYRFVRHPMYAASVPYLVGMALMLGSWWGVLGVAPLTIAFGVRAIGEEAVLRRDLSAYDAYTREVRFRLLPGVW